VFVPWHKFTERAFGVKHFLEHMFDACPLSW